MIYRPQSGEDRVWVRCRACSSDTEHDILDDFETTAAPAEDRDVLGRGASHKLLHLGACPVITRIDLE